MIFALLIPLSLAMGAAGLAVFFWAMRSGQYEDMDGAAWRVLPSGRADAPAAEPEKPGTEKPGTGPG